MNIIFHPSLGRGLTSTPWLVSRHSFSFNRWYDPGKVQFGSLRVLNDDLILPGQGFPPHSHENMEIVTIPLKGAVAHEDSTGGKGTVGAGEVQIMSAGTGVTHSEFNASSTDPLELLQVWVLPEREGLLPRYNEQKFNTADENTWQLLVSPTGEAGSLRIFQQAWFSVARVRSESTLTYEFHGKGTGAYIFIISGKVKVGEQVLGKRDALGVWDASTITLNADESAEVLVIEVAM